MMQKKYLTDLTNLVGTSSGGQFLTLSGPLSSREISSYENVLTEPFHVYFELVLDHLERHHVLHIEGNDQVSLSRALGCAWFLTMPEEGLDEALNALDEVIEFYYPGAAPELPDRTLTLHGSSGKVSKVNEPRAFAFDEL